MNKLIPRSLLNAAATVTYITIVALIMQNVQRIFGQQKDTLLDPIAALTLFVLSAAITASLVLGKPVLLFLDGNKHEAIKLFLYTLGWLALMLIILVLAMFSYGFTK